MNEVTTEIQLVSGQINGNFDEVRTYILSTLEEYKGAVFVGDESIKLAKSIVADLRKSQASLKSEVSQYKKAYLEPFEAFKKQADEIIALYDEPINYINGQVEAYVKQLKADKRKVIEELYNKIFLSDWAEHFPLDSIYDPRWENQTYKKSQIEKDLNELLTHFAQDITVICSNQSDSVEKAMAMYYRDRNLANAIQYIQNYEQQRREIEERNRAKEEQRIREEERAKLEAEIKATNNLAQAVEQAQKEAIAELIPVSEDGEESTDYVYSINLTPTEKETLELYMNSIGINYEVLS